MTLAALILAAAGLDLVTMLALPPGSEVNPIAATVPWVAIVLKVTVAVSVATLVLRKARYFRAVGVVGVVAWTVGAVSNVAVLA